MKYLVIDCEELNNSWECDAYRKPLCVTENISEWKDYYGYEIYQILEDGKLKLIKEYDDYTKIKDFTNKKNKMQVWVDYSYLYDKDGIYSMIIDVDDKFKVIDVDINTTVDVPDDFYINFLKTCHEQVSKFRKYFTIHSVRSFETGNTMAEV